MRNAWVLILLSCAAHAQDRTKLADQAKLSLVEAIDKGLSEAGDGVCFHAELEEEKGIPVYSIDVAQGKKTCNVIVDARDGSIVTKEVEDEDHSKAVALCKVKLAAAVATALEVETAVADAVDAARGKAIEARILTINDLVATVAVRIVSADRKVTVSVNGETGKARIPQALALPSVAVRPFTDTFRVDPADLVPSGRNPYFVLEPGHVLVLEGEGETLTITVLDETRVVHGISKRTYDVYYFGEEVDIYKDGAIASHDGAWLSGKDDARFGLMMPGTPLNGARYHQEIAPGVAMDRAEIVDVSVTFETPAGKFERCLKIEESTPLEKGTESKYYGPGIGLLRDGKMRLVRHGRGG
jgi:uncharacterized membrane protein YkoI